MTTTDDRLDSPEDVAQDLVRFFAELTALARCEYEALAQKDMKYGEDVAAERLASGGIVHRP